MAHRDGWRSPGAVRGEVLIRVRPPDLDRDGIPHSSVGLLVLLLGWRREWLMGALALLIALHLAFNHGGLFTRVADRYDLGNELVKPDCYSSVYQGSIEFRFRDFFLDQNLNYTVIALNLNKQT
jgi:hypothetical protein